MPRIPTPATLLRDLEVRVRAHHPLWAVDTADHERLEQVLLDLSTRTGLPLLRFTPGVGLERLPEGTRTPKTDTLESCLAFVVEADTEALFLVPDVGAALGEPRIVALLRAIHVRYFEHRGVVVLADAELDLPAGLAPLATPITLPTPTLEEYYQYVRAVLADLRRHRPITVDLDAAGVAELLNGLCGLSFPDVRRIIAQAVVDDGRLDRDDLPLVLEVKRRIVERSGVLEYFAHDAGLEEVAGLENLKDWLRTRQRAFVDPKAAAEFGLEPPRGLLLLGVQGCGKSLSAKAIASEWKLPLVRLDPSNLYTKYFGESERNFRRAVALAESLAPVVLWVDEIEKALSASDDDGGTSQRIFGTFLSWMQEKRASVFVVATANDIRRLPPELLRKGRFDEIFFIDLPDEAARADVLRVHLARRGRRPEELDLATLAGLSAGFSGAELEQAVVSALYRAFAAGRALTHDDLATELRATRPMSVTLREPIERLRTWAEDRAVRADRAR